MGEREAPRMTSVPYHEVVSLFFVFEATGWKFLREFKVVYLTDTAFEEFLYH